MLIKVTITALGLIGVLGLFDTLVQGFCDLIFSFLILMPLQIMETIQIELMPILTGKVFVEMITNNFSATEKIYVIFSSLAVISSILFLNILILSNWLKSGNSSKIFQSLRKIGEMFIFIIFVPIFFGIIFTLISDISGFVFGEIGNKIKSLANTIYHLGFKEPHPENNYYDYPVFSEYNYLIPIIAVFTISFAFLKVINALVGRIVELVFLFFLTPLIASSMTLDGGRRFQIWKSQAITCFLSGFSIQLIWLIYTTILQKIREVNFNLSFFAHGILVTLFCLSGTGFVAAASQFMNRILGIEETSFNFSKMVRSSFQESRNRLSRIKNSGIRARKSIKGMKEKAYERRQKRLRKRIYG